MVIMRNSYCLGALNCKKAVTSTLAYFQCQTLYKNPCGRKMWSVLLNSSLGAKTRSVLQQRTHLIMAKHLISPVWLDEMLLDDDDDDRRRTQ